MQCPTCHQPILPEYYFCPNCGTELRVPPLNTTTYAQVKLYAHSVVLPLLAFITISKWKGAKYIKSQDEKTRRIGMIAILLLGISTIAVVWYTVYATTSFLQTLNDTLMNY